MKRLAARLLIALGLGLVALGKRLDRGHPPAAKMVTLQRRHYRPVPPLPRRPGPFTLFVVLATG